jgi:hypothetical protein
VSESDKTATKVEERPPATASPPATAVVAAPAAPAVVNAPQPPAPAIAPPVATPPQPRCLDCGALLEGKYCIACGQRAQVRNLSIPSLAHDAIHDLAHFDSRGWVTLRALLFRPGFLTSEFIHGRRTRYLPPFRLYLVLSLVFFVVLSCKPSEDVVTIATGQGTTRVVTGGDPEAVRQAMEELKRELATDAAADPKARAAAEKAIAMSESLTDPDSALMAGTACTDMTWSAAGKEWVEPRLVEVCEHLQSVSKRQFGRELLRNIPKMMFLFLPLLALVNLLLYAFRRRKYVEHLLFYVHFHAFAFLLLTLQIVAAMVFGWIGLAFAGSVLSFAVMVYLFVALFKAMRAVYGQSRLMTSVKYLTVLIAYGTFSLLTLFGTVFYTAMTV